MTSRLTLRAPFTVYPLLAVLAWAPFPLGSNRAWAMALLAMLFAGLTVFLVATGFHRLNRIAGKLNVPAFVAVALFIWMACAPLFSAVNTDDLFETLLMWAATIFAFGCAFMLSLEREDSASIIVMGLAAIVTIYAVYGVFSFTVTPDLILWFDRYAYEDSTTSTFVNRNSFAAYTGMGLISLLAIFATQLSNQRTSKAATLRGRLADLARAVSGLPLISGAILVVSAALLLSLSRGGVIFTLFGLATLMMLHINFRKLSWRSTSALVGIAVLITFFELATSGTAFIDRIESSGLDGGQRVMLYETSASMISDRPIVGFGGGGFETSFPAYRPMGMDVHADFDKAHSTYLEVVLDVGIPAALAFFGICGWLVYRCWAGFQKRRRGRIYPILGLSITILVGLHSLVDFPLQIPAVSVTYAALMGACVAQSYPSSQRRNRQRRE